MSLQSPRFGGLGLIARKALGKTRTLKKRRVRHLRNVWLQFRVGLLVAELG
jgi:hypothetical protein